MRSAALDRIPTDEAAQSELRERLVARTRELFRLMVAALGSSPRSASGAVAVDLRSIQDMRTVPSVELVTRVGSGLGLEPEIAVGVVASGLQPGLGRASVREALVAADLADDARGISELAMQLAAKAERPCDLALAQLAEGRACVARGDLAAAESHAGNAREIGIAPADRANAFLLSSAALFDATVGSPWARGLGFGGAFRWFVEASSPAADEGPLAPRAAGFREAQLLADGVRSVHAARGWLDAALSGTRPVELRAWIASSVALAAIRRIGAAEGELDPLVHLFVAAQLALGELATEARGAARAAVESRRSRVAFAEWSLRVDQDGLHEAWIDESDAREIARACMRLDAGGRLCSRRQLSDFMRSRKSTLDASSGESWMVELVQCPHATGACAGSRSEDPC